MAMKITDKTDLAQAVQTIKWLDEERRKDKAEIAKLEERLQEQTRQIAQQSTQIQELQTTLAEVRRSLSKIGEFEQMVTNFKKEVNFQFQERDETWRKERNEAKRLRRIEHESLKKQLGSMEKDLRVLPRYDEELSARKSEEQRLSDAIQHLEATVADLDNRLEDPEKAVSYLEERRRSDHRRLTELEQEIPDLHRKIEKQADKIPPLEEMIRKQEPRIAQAIEEAKKYEKPIEELRISDFQREQKMQRYLDQGEEVAQELERVREQAQGFLEQRQTVKRALSALEKFKKRIERRQDEIVEKQRVAEERILREWDEWQSARSKALKKQEMVIQERWKRQEQFNEDIAKRFPPLEAADELYHEQLNALWETHRADAMSLLEAAQNAYEELIAPIDEQIAHLNSEQQE